MDWPLRRVGTKKSTPPPNQTSGSRSTLKENAAKKKPAKIDFAAVEKKQKLTLAAGLQGFRRAVGANSFEDVMEQEGFAVHRAPAETARLRGIAVGR
jgi:hypothetical protein